MTTPEIRIPGFVAGRWHNAPAAASYDATAGALTLTSGPKTDWNVDAMEGSHADSAPAILFQIDGDFELSARVAVNFTDTFDAGVLCVRSDSHNWAKLCFERSPQGHPMVVSVVTQNFSDDANATVIDDGEVSLRISRIGDAFVFHYSLDREWWHFVRQFRLSASDNVRVGFLSQSPFGAGSTANFTDIRRDDVTLGDRRNGS